MEPVSIGRGVIKEGIIAATEVAERTAEVSKLTETTIKEIGNILEKQKLTEGISNINELAKNILNPTKQDFIDYKNMFSEIEVAKENPNVARALINKLDNGSNFKGSMGEYITGKNLSRYSIGPIESQVKVSNEIGGYNKLDFKVNKINSNTEFMELKSSKDGIESIPIFLKEGQSLAMEVKNASLPYFKEQVTGGHLLEQVRAGKSVCDSSFVGITKDLAETFVDKPEVGGPLISSINEAGGSVVIALPDIITQKIILGGLMGI